MQNIKYMVTGITQGRLEGLLEQIKKDNVLTEHGVLVVGLDPIPEVFQLKEDGSTARLNFADFIHRFLNKQEE